VDLRLLELVALRLQLGLRPFERVTRLLGVARLRARLREVGLCLLELVALALQLRAGLFQVVLLLRELAADALDLGARVVKFLRAVAGALGLRPLQLLAELRDGGRVLGALVVESGRGCLELRPQGRQLAGVDGRRSRGGRRGRGDLERGGASGAGGAGAGEAVGVGNPEPRFSLGGSGSRLTRSPIVSSLATAA
jgi:hypothetical protein